MRFQFQKVFVPAAIVVQVLLGCARLHADLVIEVQDTVLKAGGQGTLDVFIHSDGIDNVDAFQYKFRITPGGLTVGDLMFSNPQSSSELTDSGYIHFGDSGGFTSVPTNGPAYDQILGGDFTLSLQGTDVAGVDLILVRLEIQHVLPSGTPPESAAGDSFIIALVDDSDTFFLDRAFNALNWMESSGVVNISAVPEPTSLAVIPGLVLILFWRRER